MLRKPVCEKLTPWQPLPGRLGSRFRPHWTCRFRDFLINSAAICAVDEQACSRLTRHSSFPASDIGGADMPFERGTQRLEVQVAVDAAELLAGLGTSAGSSHARNPRTRVTYSARDAGANGAPTRARW